MTRTIKTVNDEKTISHIINGKEFSMSKKRYDNAIRRFRRYWRKGAPIEKLLNKETYKRVVGNNKRKLHE
jgi:hypothetical protein|tara:strand:+ start:363 stop:572 length:210 start_codon:yes stop_codon:yes gene_type:complete